MRRSAASIVARVAAAAGLALVVAPALAHGADAEARGGARIVDVLLASHVGTVDGSITRWRSRYVLADRTSRNERVVFAAPLPLGATIETGGSAVTGEGGRIVAVDLASDAPVVSIVTPNEPRGHVDPPLAEGDGVQVVDVGGAQELRFEPAPAQGIERRVGHFAAIDLDEDAIASADARLGAVGTTRGPPIYVRASTHARGGLDGTLTTGAERSRPVVAFLGVACALGVAAMGLLHRLLARSAKIEVADAALNERFTRLEK